MIRHYMITLVACATMSVGAMEMEQIRSLKRAADADWMQSEEKRARLDHSTDQLMINGLNGLTLIDKSIAQLIPALNARNNEYLAIPLEHLLNIKWLLENSVATFGYQQTAYDLQNFNWQTLWQWYELHHEWIGCNVPDMSSFITAVQVVGLGSLCPMLSRIKTNQGTIIGLVNRRNRQLIQAPIA